MTDDVGDYEIVVANRLPPAWWPAAAERDPDVPDTVLIHYAWERHHFAVELPRAVREDRN